MSFERSSPEFGSKKRRPYRKIGAVSLVLAIECGVMVSGYSDAVAGPEATTNDKNCAIISDETIEQTKSIYADTWVDISATTPYGETTEAHAIATKRETFDVADELGLTIYDYKTEFADLGKDINSVGSVLPVEDYYDAAKEFLERYGVELTFSSDRVEDGIFGQVTLDSYDQMVEENSDHAKRQLYEFIETIGELPVELVQYMGLKKIVFVKIELLNNTIPAAGFAESSDPSLNTIYVDLDKPYNHMITHEMFHLWDARVCGPLGMSEDEQFNALNPFSRIGNFYGIHGNYLSESGATEEVLNEGLGEELDAATSWMEAFVARSQIHKIMQKVAVSSEYGFTNMVEDKATVGESILSRYNRDDIQDMGSPILQQKTLLLTARLYADVPNIVEYLARTGYDAFDPETNVLAK